MGIEIFPGQSAMSTEIVGMNLSSAFHSELFTWVILPLLIFIARIVDVTIGTIRIMFVTRGNRFFAPLLGFFEVLIWLMAIGQIMQNLNNVFCYLAYAGGFAMGNFIGIYVEEKLALGKLVVRVITKKDASDLIESLRKKGFGATSVDAEGSTGRVNIIFTVIKRSDLKEVVGMIHRFNPKAFYSIEDTRLVKAGIFPRKTNLIHSKILEPLGLMRKIRLSRRMRTVRKGK